MSTQTDSQENPKLDVSKTSETQAQKRLDRAAEEAAEKGEKTEQRYDRDHNIFTK